ncbi:MAG: chorismate mutase [Clostridia bacterium]|nr:chorismate mutase [Clostridia bacterium]
MKELEKARMKIDEIDKRMAHLFEERMDAVNIVAEYKKEVGKPVEDKNREMKLIENNSKYIENFDYLPYYNDFLSSTIRISKNYQNKLIDGVKISISGTKGAFADVAAKKVYSGAKNVSFSDFSSAYDAAVNGETDYAFLPIENSFGGDVGAVLDLAFYGNLYINGIYETDIVQNLLVKTKTKFEDIKCVISHPQAILQCGQFIKANNFETRNASNTTEAAKIVALSDDNSIAAIASSEAAKNYGLKIIKSAINESNQNTTRFAVFSRSKSADNHSDNRFVIMFTVRNIAGALSKAISVIGNYGYNLLDLKSRPTKLEKWKHYFFIEGEGNINSDNGKNMLKELENCCDNLKVVGSFEKEVQV